MQPNIDPTGKIKIMIVDDHAVVREGLEAVIGLQADMVIVASVATGEEGLRTYAQEKPDVVLLDVRLPGMDGLETLNALRSQHPEARVVMVSSQEGEEAIWKALRAGALGYVFKKSPSAEILSAIRSAATGKVPISGDVADRLAERERNDQLSEREVAVLVRVGRGLSNKEIADELTISPNTVKNHINNIMTKLAASDRTHAVTIALQRGVIDLVR